MWKNLHLWGTSYSKQTNPQTGLLTGRGHRWLSEHKQFLIQAETQRNGDYMFSAFSLWYMSIGWWSTGQTAELIRGLSEQFWLAFLKKVGRSQITSVPDPHAFKKHITYFSHLSLEPDLSTHKRMTAKMWPRAGLRNHCPHERGVIHGDLYWGPVPDHLAFHLFQKAILDLENFLKKVSCCKWVRFGEKVVSGELQSQRNKVIPIWQWKHQFSSVTQLCLTLCDPMDCSTPGLPVHYQLPELTQTHVHWVSDAIQPSHPLLSPSPPVFNLSQHQGLFQGVSSSH